MAHMTKNICLSFLMVYQLFSSAYSQSSCDPHPLFNMLPNHYLDGCDEKEFDVLKVNVVDKDGAWVKHEKRGYLLETFYTFDGDFEKRPSNPMIFKNYIDAVISKGGAVIYESKSLVFLQLKLGGESWWIQVKSDQSGTYSVTSVREQPMNQYIVLSAEDIAREINASGKATFYGIYFDTDKVEIKPESKETLEQMANYLNSNPDVTVYLVGHTDNTGSIEHNQMLSEKRAEAVIKELVDSHNVNGSRLKAYGVASLSPVSNNSSEEGKSKNRRVEMVLR